ncbi:MAG TPA: hypothetical protein DCZ95_13995 [Verrucomicrobia bacterium]|nr:MAG: hypothetical protein A2X46_12970 [Lentisphaerae bacterium GWF2_57_35]HBA85196.1 hypothetical protein [Verrucomicrobiota bacterium]
MNKLLVGWLFSFWSLAAFGAPANQALLDGRPTEYDSTDLRAVFSGANAWGIDNVITNFYVTWDTNYLYVALQGWENNNKLTILLDVDPGHGTGASATTNWSRVLPDYIRYNDVGWLASTNEGATPYGLDYLISSEGFYNNFLRILYDGDATPDSNTVVTLFDSGNGDVPLGTPVDMVVKADATACILKGFEAKIPWLELYNTNLNRFGQVEIGEIVPRGAALRLFANLHNNDPTISYSSPDALPMQTSPHAFYTNGILMTDTYLEIPVDQDNDGIPDVAVGDVNAPFLRYVAGAAGQPTVYVQFNEPVTAFSAADTNNWRVDGEMPGAVNLVATNAALLQLTNSLPAEGALVRIAADHVYDNNGNAKLTTLCLFPSSNGLPESVTVRFVLQTASGLGANPGSSNFFLNGSAFPLDWGYPPSTSTPLQRLSGSLYYADVTFPPTTPQTLNYKFSGILYNTRTNNYEAVRLTDFAGATRVLTLQTNLLSLTITDCLGAAAHPWRDPNNTNQTAHANLFIDTRRGDAGVRERRTMLFKLDLSGRDTRNLTRVLLQGSDPLRGFNSDGGKPNAIVDFAGAPGIGWSRGGVSLYDDGSHGDQVSGDKIYSRLWSFTPDGLDSAIETTFPYSLVGGGYGTLPYDGDSYWVDRRSPRSFIYKYYVVRSSGDSLESPGYNLEYYIETTNTAIELPTFVWDNEALPLPPASNSPILSSLVFTGGVTTLLFENTPNELQHGVEISTNLLSPWLDFGQRAATNTAGEWVAIIQGAAGMESYRAFAGPAKPYTGVRWEPNPLPPTGGTLRVYFTQHSRALAGDRNVQIAGSFNGWSPAPMTFLGDGLWYVDALVGEAASSNIEFKIRNLGGSTWLGMGGDENWRPNYLAYKGVLRASWSPSMATNGQLLNVSYDADGGPLAGATNVNAYVGFDENWAAANTRRMTNLGGTVWDLAFPVPSNYSLSVNFVFNGNTNATATVWDSESGSPIAGRQWRVFIAQPQ